MPIPREVLKKYAKANVFIETGTHIGNTVQVALELGFKKIYSIELAKHHYENCVKKFKRRPEVNLIYGASEYEIPKILSNLNEPAVFWLDGHYSEGDTALGEVAVPLYLELEAIAKHHINNHIILVDDVRLMGTEWKDISLDRVKELVLEVNPSYNITFEDGFHAGTRLVKDILVACL